MKIDITTRHLRKSIRGWSSLKRMSKIICGSFLADFAYVSITVTSDRDIKTLNYKYLKRRYPTDVIAFDLGPQPGKGRRSRVGEIAVSFERARAQAKEFGVTPKQELIRLIIHGIIHLAGFEDVKGYKKLLKMRDAEIKALQMLL